MRTIAITCALVALVSIVVFAQSGNDLFQQALVKQNTERNYSEAIKIYQKIIQKYGSDRKLVAKAWFEMGQAYEKLGDSEARKAYERISKEFADQKEIVSDANQRLAALNAPQSSNPLTPRVALTGDDVDLEATISPDGQWMAMADWSTKEGHLAIREMATGQMKRLQNGTCNGAKTCTFAEGAVFSPDMRQLAYTWYDDSQADGQGQLRIIANEVGAKPRVLVRNPENNIYTLGWSADAKSILITNQKLDRTWQLGWTSVTDGAIRTIKSLDWRVPRSVHLSPDGRYIVYSALSVNPSKAPPAAPESTERHIYVLASNGANETEVVKTAGINDNPIWSPDGGYVVFTSNVSGKTDLWSVPVRNGNRTGPTLLRADIGEIYPIAMMRSGAFYYGQRRQASVEQVSIAELSPGGRARILESFVGMNPSWSPDGKSIAFKRHTAQTEDSYYAVVRSLDDGHETVLPRNGLRADPPRWLHDNRFLTLVGNPEQWWNIVDLKTGEFKQFIRRFPTRTGLVAVSPDDKTFYIADGQPADNSAILVERILAVDIATGQERQVFRLPGAPETLPRAAAFGITLSPDGRTLAMATINPKTQEARISLVDVDGTNFRELYGPYRTDTTYDKIIWAKTGGAIFFTALNEREGKPEIMRIAVAGGKPQPTGLLTTAVRNSDTFDVSPDASRIAITSTARKTSKELFIIDNLSALLKDSQ
jgi:Tol biopolymer transport system component